MREVECDVADRVPRDIQYPELFTEKAECFSITKCLIERWQAMCIVCCAVYLRVVAVSQWLHSINVIVVVMGDQYIVERPVARRKRGFNRGRFWSIDERGFPGFVIVQQKCVIICATGNG